MNKKGVSDIVVTILLVLLALAAIALVWGFIQGQLRGAQTQISQSQSCMNLKLEPVSCDLSGAGTNATVRYKLGNSVTNLTGVRVIIEKMDGSASPQIAGAPGVLETKSFVTNVLKANAKRFSIAGVITIDNKEVFCSETDKIDCK